MLLENLINRLRIVAFFLFLFPTIAIIGSILINNYIVSFKYNFQIKYSDYLNDIPGDSFEKVCNLNNNSESAHMVITTRHLAEICFDKKFRQKWNERNLKLDDLVFKYAV